MASILQPQIILLKEGTDTSQGKPQLVSNINAYMAIADVVRTTLGPRGMDKLIHDEKGNTTISNDGATIMKLLDIRHIAAKILVDIAKSQDSEVPGGTMRDYFLVNGVAFKKTFSYAGFEQQPKKFFSPKILLLNIELELKSEKENAEIRLSDPMQYQSIVDAEWNIIYDKLNKCVKSGAKVVLSRLAIGDLGTQVLGSCDLFEERQVGNERFNIFSGCPCPSGRTATIVLRGGADQFIEEAERSLHDAIMIVRRALRNSTVVAGGGAIDMEISRYLRQHARTIAGKSQLFINSYAKALEIFQDIYAFLCK